MAILRLPFGHGVLRSLGKRLLDGIKNCTQYLDTWTHGYGASVLFSGPDSGTVSVLSCGFKKLRLHSKILRKRWYAYPVARAGLRLVWKNVHCFGLLRGSYDFAVLSTVILALDGDSSSIRRSCWQCSHFETTSRSPG